MGKKKSLFSLSKGDTKVIVREGVRGSFDVVYSEKGEDPVEVGVHNLELAMDIARGFIDEASEDN